MPRSRPEEAASQRRAPVVWDHRKDKFMLLAIFSQLSIGETCPRANFSDDQLPKMHTLNDNCGPPQSQTRHYSRLLSN
ncbi:hypothetical protein BDW68DRAFT_98994 [Aspergillus falconensis]